MTARRYNGGIKRHADRVQPKYRRVFVAFCNDVGSSIRDGSPVTGAPGQPRRTSNLYLSWIDEFLSRFRWQMSTNVSYAPFVEDNVRNVRFRNGGAHSVKLTILGANRLMQVANERSRDA